MSMEASLDFHQAQILNGICFGHSNYEVLMQGVLNYLVEKVNPKSVLEIGPGTGVLLYQMLAKGLDASGVDVNEFSQKYFQDYCKSNGRLGDSYQYILFPFFENRISYHKAKWKTDLLISIEVFEHMTDEQIKFYLDNIEAKYFFFSSTPHKSEPWVMADGSIMSDERWNHINIKQEPEWLDMFSKYGYKLIDRPGYATHWDLLLEKRP